MLDFTALPTRKKFYAGANGAKIAVIYDGEQYMLKFPAPAPKNKELSYANSCISEYIGCHIFNSVGIAAQETLLVQNCLISHKLWRTRQPFHPRC